MPNYEGNSQIAVYGAATRFGVGSCPVTAQCKASKPWSIARAVRRMAALKVSIDEPVTMATLLEPLGHRFTFAQLAAAKLFVDALNGSHRAMMRIEYIIDGPVESALPD